MPLTSFFPRAGGFDPLEGEVPWYLPRKLAEIVARSRAILEGETRESVHLAAIAIDCLVEHYFADARSSYIDSVLEARSWVLSYLPEDRRDAEGLSALLDDWPTDAKDLRPTFPSSENTNDYQALRLCIDLEILNKSSSNEDWLDEKYFAVLALSKVADCILSASQRDRFHDADQAIPSLLKEAIGLAVWPSMTSEQAILDDLIEATEAVAWAERLQMCAVLLRLLDRAVDAHVNSDQIIAERVGQATRAQMSLNAVKAADVRHSRNRELKMSVWAWCDENMQRFSSMDAAAEALKTGERPVPVSFRTVRDWIGQWRKRLRSARKP